MYKILLVGGSIRDKLIKLKANEKDWLILNSNYKTISNLGFRLVGKDFPVFLHPITKEEYALARKERKIKLGYNGFKCYFFSSIKLKDDLFRRDITVNSIILNKNGKIIDFFNGLTDIKNKKIRHISYAFIEDPLRILRLARLTLKYYNIGFTITTTTYNLIKKIKKNEIKNLTSERITKEIYNSIKLKNFHIFFNLIKVFNKLKILNYNLNFFIDFSKKFKFNKSLNYWTNTINVLKEINIHTNNKTVNIAIIINELNHDNNLNQIKFFNIPKKQIKFISNFLTLLNFWDLISKNLYIIKNLSLDILNNKNKIKLINAILMCEKITKIKKYNHNFYTKYVILEIIDKLNKKTKKYTNSIKKEENEDIIKSNICKTYRHIY